MSLNPKVPSWKDQRVWIVGASSGIGASLARRLINEGARVALSARSRDRLQEIASDTD
ncbi:MAG: SDR family NAD(P)-dependent oxidoreductase, partial [Burkholderiaceae bacterium]